MLTLSLALAVAAATCDSQGQPGSTVAQMENDRGVSPLPISQSHRFDSAEEQAHWRMSVMPYLWAASLKGDVTVKGVTSQVDASFSDIFKGLDYAFIGQAELQHGRFLIIPDTLLLKVSQSVTIDANKTGKFGLVNVSGKVSASADMLSYFQELVAGYRVYERRREGTDAESLSLDLLGGGALLLYFVGSYSKCQSHH